MIRTAARNAVLLASVALGMGALAVNCSQRNTVPNSNVGSVGLAITLPSGAIVSTVHYSLENSGGSEVATGDIPVADSGSTISLVIGGVAAGTGYTVTLSATASDGSSCLGTSAPFAVTANSSTSVNVLLLCRGVTGTGTVTASGQIDNCPAVASYVVSPLATGLGGHITVNATGTDLDAGDVVTYAWTATAGTFNTPSSASATFTCPAAASMITLTITVSDSPAAGSTTPKCSTSKTIAVNCGVAAVCGNNMVETGEQCDPPNGTTCSATCQIIPAGTGGATGRGGGGAGGAGTGGAVASTGGAGTGGAGTGGAVASTGGTGTGGAGTGGAGTGGAVASTGGSGTGGAGTGGAVASTGGAGTGGAGTGGAMASGGITLGCQQCETAVCLPQGVGCSTLTGTAKTACDAAVACVRTTHCDVQGDASFCYCGTASQDDGSCSAAPLGLCIAQFEAADPNILPTDSVTVRFNKIATDLVDPTLPIGKATGIIGCDAFSCDMPTACTGQF
jgi:hypothetical protein